jgi:hypothetical protein
MSYRVGVTVTERPAAAPPTGPYELGVIAVGSPGFVAGLVAALNLFCMPSMPMLLIPSPLA